MNYLMSKLKERFESEDKEINPQELNYKVGNTSGMDVGQVPAEIAERVGNLAQRGGGEMEILLNNPSTFHIDREDLYSTIEGLQIDVSLHSDPNIGYTSAYKTGQGRGFEVTRSYFTNYLKEYASFKREKEERDDLSFRLGRINPHISTSPMPSLRERMAQDVGLDPFGFPISEYHDQFISMRDQAGQNIFRNPDFLENFYKAFILSEVDDEYQIYGLFQRFSPEFRQQWRKAQAKSLNKFWDSVSEYTEDPLSEKIAMFEAAQMSDRGINTEWINLLRDKGESVSIQDPIKIQLGRVSVTDQMDDDEVEQRESVNESVSELEVEIENLNELFQTSEVLFGQGIDQIRALSRIKDRIENENIIDDYLESIGSALPNQFKSDIEEGANIENKYKILELIEEGLNKLWKGNGDLLLVSVQAKTSALNSRLDIEQTQILERAQEEDLEDHAVAVMRGDDEDYFEQEGAETKSPDRKHIDLLNSLMNNFEQALWMESNIFYKIIPAWMSSSNQEYEDDGELVHKAFEAPEFIWRVIVEREHGEQSFDEDYLRKLESDPDFRQDVVAASAAVYVWSHFTQVESQFDADRYQYIESDECTWIEWMNRYGIGVNFEAMYGSPNEELKLWRSKDIVAAARAINITARKDIDEFHDELHGSPAKFTIDMEHVSSFGIDPWKDMENLIEMEKWIANNNEWDVPADEEKPLAEMVRMYHLTKPGNETRQSASGHTHGPFRHGDTQLYTWLHDMVENGFTQSDERASIMYEVGGEMTGTVQKAKLSMNMIELGISPEELDPAKVDPGKEYRNEEEALIARFYGMDRPSFNREWAKIEDHAFDPLQGLLESEEFDHTWTSTAALKNDTRPQEFQSEEYK
jgi:hypothetical protein